MYLYAAFIVGLVSGVVYSWVKKKLERKRVDDPLDAVAGTIQIRTVKMSNNMDSVLFSVIGK